MKAIDIINIASTYAGIKAIGDPLSGDDQEHALILLNTILDSYNTRSLYIPDTTEITQVVTGQLTTIGIGQAINVVRPVRMLDTSYFRINGIDYPITWMNQAEFNEIPLKAITGSWPFYGYYDGGIPTGNIFWYPLASNNELHLQVESQLSAFADYTTDYNVPQGYQDLLTLELTKRLCFGLKQLPDDIAIELIKMRRWVKDLNETVTEQPNWDDCDDLSPRARFMAGA